ncbi:MAG TPA: MFS transporter [Armatimonadota bacterium]
MPNEAHDPYAALRLREYQLYALGNVLGILGAQAQSVAVGWELYERTHSKLALGYVGLVQILPVILLTFPAGHLADRLDRRIVLIASQIATALCSLGLAALSVMHGPVIGTYALLFLAGCAMAVRNPSRAALMPQIVPAEVFSNAVTWNSTCMQVASVAGPAMGGVMLAVLHGAAPVFAAAALTSLAFAAVVSMIRVRSIKRPTEPVTLRSVIAGAGFVYRTKIILAAITMDMFAVLLGGATVLLPVYAKDILKVGPGGLGWLQAAPSAGAFCMAIYLAHARPMQRAGTTLLWAVSGFGAATIVFGLSRSFLLSLGMLFLTGVFDNVSVVIRQTLVQLRTPDELRGRVAAVNGLFIGTSNQLGGFESGLVAQYLTPQISVVAGGVGTIVVVLGVAAIWPQLRRLGRLHEAVVSDTGGAASP